MSKRVLFAIGIALAFMFSVSSAKKAPGPESIVADQYAQTNSGPARPLQNEYDGNGIARILYHPAFHSQKTETAEIAIDFLGQNSGLLGLKGDGSDLTLLSTQSSLAGYHYRYQQVWQGVPVFASEVLINITRAGRISSVISDYKQGVDISIVPAIDDQSARAIAIKALDVKAFSGETSARLVIYAQDMAPTLCWMISIPAERPLGDWQVFVDAQNGTVVARKNIMCFVDGSGMAFNPNPVVSTQNLNLADSSNRDYPALTDARFQVLLRDLNAPQGGYYYLSGTYVNTTATANRAHFVTPDSFNFTRSNARFEETMAYFQIDSCARFYRALGFDNLMNYSISLAVNGTTDDNSWFSPGQNRITYGSGGVDDAEDGDVIVHEYGHATQYNQVPGWGQTEEGGAMGEGFGDYLSVAVAHPVSGGWREAVVFDWDANPRDHFWAGRRVDGNKHYPQDMHYEVHDDGEIWSRCLWDIMNAVGYDTSLTLVLESHYSLTPQANFHNGADAIVQADRDLYGGRHLLAIGQAFVDRGIYTELPIHLTITHQPLGNTEDENVPFDILATVVHDNPLDTLNVFYRFRADSVFTAVAMTPAGDTNQFQTQIPAPGHADSIFYYVRAVDNMGLARNLPSGAPSRPFGFYAGPDTVPPVISHAPLGDMPTFYWPPLVSATVTDNYGVDSVWVEYEINNGPTTTVSLGRVDTGSIWSTTLIGSVNAGDSISYRIKARDISNAGNIAYLPGDGYYGFRILNTQTVEYMADGFDIPDGSGSVYDTIIVSDRLQIYEVDVYVNITHPYIGDLYFYIKSPRNRVTTLHYRTGGDGDSIVGWYDDDIPPDGPGNMAQFNGDSSQGSWVFYIGDRVSGNVGHLNSWGVRIRGIGNVDAVDNAQSLPDEFAVMQNYPNPFNPSTQISFTVPQAGPVRLQVFDILGREVATLVDASLGAGTHTVEWDGKSNSGEAVSSGIYFARLIAGEKHGIIRMSLLK